MKHLRHLLGLGVLIALVSTAGAQPQPYGNMALIPAGSFTMGDTLDGDANAIPVTANVSAFYMDTNSVSKSQWDDVYTWAIAHGYTFDYAGSGKAANHPVQTINWWDSVKWCNARSEKEGRTPAYYTDAGLATVYRSGQLSPSVNWAAGYRLPTEAEWEKAARGGLNGQRFPWGNTISQSLANFYNAGGESYQTGPTGSNATYGTGSYPFTSPVGSFAPNGYGLFDMAGNVWQWCWDWYGTPYAGGTDPRGAASGSYRVYRGGGWFSNALYCRAAFRSGVNPTLSSRDIGFRSVLPPMILSTDLTNLSAVVGSNPSFQVVASGSAPFTYQWFYTNGYPPATAGAYAQTIAGFVYGAVVTNGGFGYGSAPNVRFVGGGGNGAGAYASVSNGIVISITVTNAGGGYATLPSVAIDPPSGLLAGQTNSSLTISNVGPSNLGSYWVVVSNGSGSVTSSVANLTLLYPPTIAVPPVSQSLALRGSTTLSVTPSGTPPFSYQWTLAGTNLPAATNSTLVLTNFSLGQVGGYAVTVTSPYGSATSSSAQVSMLPSINAPFMGGVDLWGQPTTFTVGAVGTGDLLYQWYFNGLALAGATSNSYTLGAIQFTNAGLYSVVVSSSLGSATNTPYQVVVNPANVSLGLYPGITVSGTVGYTYTIQGTTDLSDTNAWVTLANLTLTQPVQIWSDYTADTTQSQNPRKFYRVVAGNVPVGMALIPAGPFTMGDTLDGIADAAPVTVTVSAFYMDTNLVSKAVWDDVYSWAIGHGYTFDNFGSGKASTHPVQTINWWDSVKWCNARSEKEGRAPAYYTDAGLTTVYRSGQLSPSVNWAVGYRLPTEAEWEKAARGGLHQNRFPWGNTISQSLANFYNVFHSHPTGFFKKVLEQFV